MYWYIYALKTNIFKLLRIAQTFYIIPFYSLAGVVLLQNVA